MYHHVLGDAKLPAFLLRCDEEIAAEARRHGCRRCDGVLHRANYRRKPRGGAWALGPDQDVRHSLCCARVGCRRRVTPASIRFLPRRVYLAAVVVLAAALMQGPTPWRVRQLTRYLGVSRRTLVRWQRYWREEFVATTVWSHVQARVVPAPESTPLPWSLLVRFVGSAEAQVLALLRLLCMNTLFEGRPPSAEDAR